MSFIDYVDGLKKKPERERRKILYLVTTLCTGAIFLGWIFIVYPKTSRNATEHASRAYSPFSTIKKSISQSFDGVKKEFGDMRATLAESFDFSNPHLEGEESVPGGGFSATSTTSTSTPEVENPVTEGDSEEEVGDFKQLDPLNEELDITEDVEVEERDQLEGV